jgi:hypothetical protein
MKIRRGIAGLLACVATSAIILVATPLPASADPCTSPSSTGANCPQPFLFIQLVNVGSDKCFLTTPQDGHYDWAGLPIQQRTCDYPFLGPYAFVPLGGVLFNEGPPWYCPGCIRLGAEGFFIKNTNLTTDLAPPDGLCMDVRDGAKSDGAVVQQWTCRDSTARSMVWYTEQGDFPGALKVKNFNSELCLDVRGGSSAEFAQLQQYHCTSNNPAQNFWQMDGRGTQMDLNGNWTDGSTRSAHIYEGPSACPQPQCVSIMIDMSAFGRPNANGSTVDPSTITVTFPDDKTYTGQVQPPNTIRWSNGSIWTKN